MGWPTTRSRASSSVWRIFSPPGTSPTPVWPALSVRISRLRVKNGPCAPLRFSSMLSRPATGITRSSVMTGVEVAWDSLGHGCAVNRCVILPVSITFFQRANSCCWKVANCAGVLATTSRPMAVNCCLTAGSFSAATIARLRLGAHGRRQALGRDDRLPRIDLDVLHARFGHGRHVGQHRRALVAGDRQRLELAGLDVLERPR